LPHIELSAPVLFTIAGLPVSNTILTAWLGSALLIIIAFAATRRMALVPGRFQNAFELLVDGLLTISAQTADERRARRFFPLIGTFFMFILISNWIGILPLFGEGELYVNKPAADHAAPAADHAETTAEQGATEEHAEASAEGEGGTTHVSILRSANSDLNVTGAMALIVFVWSEWLGIRAGGLAYLKEFIWPGLLIEIVSHIARAAALALRLFGNILAGEILLTIMSGLVPLLIPVVFLGLEMFVGLVQALIFALLTLAFMTLATQHETTHHEAAGETSHH
jgi:F-type H+-transporting ATPase subunit a